MNRASVNRPPVDRKNFGRIESGSPSGSNSAVECDLAKVEVAGSNPVSRSKVSGEGRTQADGESGLRLSFDNYRRRSQVVRQRSAKPLSIGSIPIAASIFHRLFSNLRFTG